MRSRSFNFKSHLYFLKVSIHYLSIAASAAHFGFGPKRTHAVRSWSSATACNCKSSSSCKSAIFIVLFTSTREHAWFGSCQSKDAGLLLSCVPKTLMHTLPNQHFEATISPRHFTSQKWILFRECETTLPRY